MPTLKTRADLEATLAEGIREIDMRLAKIPDYDVYQVIRRQMGAIQGWIANGRTPTEEEREKISMGLIAARELDLDDPEMAELCYAIASFMRGWPPGD